MSSAASDDLDLAAIRLFLSVVELGSVSKAAARHSLAQPSATSKLQKLERQLGVTLLDRGPTGSRATTTGVRLAPTCAELLETATGLSDRATALRSEAATLDIAATRHVADHWLAAWISDAELREVRVDVTELDTLRVVQAVRSGEASLGFIEGPSAPVGLRSQVVASEELVAVVGRTHPWAGRTRSLTSNQVASATLIVTRSGSGTRDVLEAAFAVPELGGVGEHVEVDNLASARIAAVNGVGVGFLPRCRVDADLRDGRLAAIRVKSPPIMQPVRVVWRGATPPTEPARTLVDSIGSIAAGRTPDRAR